MRLLPFLMLLWALVQCSGRAVGPITVEEDAAQPPPLDLAAASPDLTHDASPGIGFNTGKTCGPGMQCANPNDTCLKFHQWPHGVCAGRCYNKGEACQTSDPSKYISLCVGYDIPEGGNKFCLYLCEYDGKNYPCPDPNQACAYLNDLATKLCTPQPL